MIRESSHRKPIKKIAVIHDLSSVGSVALMNIIPVLSVMGSEVCPIPTMLLSTHTGGFGVPKIRKQEGYIKDCSSHFKEIGIAFDTVFVGYLGSPEAIEETELFLVENKTSHVILDPIFGDHGSYYSNFDRFYVEKVKTMIPYSEIMLPNYTEACMLSGIKYEEQFKKESIEEICGILNGMGCGKIVITSIPGRSKAELGIAVYENNQLTCHFYDRMEMSYPGTGDLFAAVLTGVWVKDRILNKAVIKAHQFVETCIKDSVKYRYPSKEGVLFQKNLILLADR